MPPLRRAYGVCSLVVFAAALILGIQGRPQVCRLSVSPATGFVQMLPGQHATIVCSATCLGPLSRRQLFWRDPRGKRVPEYGWQRVTTVSYNRWTVSRLLILGGQQQDSGVYTCEVQHGSRLLQYPATVQIEDTTTKDPGPVRGDIFIHPEPDLSPIRPVRSASRQPRRQPARENAAAPVPDRPLTLYEHSAEQPPPSDAAAGDKENAVKVNDILLEFEPEVRAEEGNYINRGEGDDTKNYEDGQTKKRIRRQADNSGHMFNPNITNDYDGNNTFSYELITQPPMKGEQTARNTSYGNSSDTGAAMSTDVTQSNLSKTADPQTDANTTQSSTHRRDHTENMTASSSLLPPSSSSSPDFPIPESSTLPSSLSSGPSDPSADKSTTHFSSSHPSSSPAPSVTSSFSSSHPSSSPAPSVTSSEPTSSTTVHPTSTDTPTTTPTTTTIAAAIITTTTTATGAAGGAATTTTIPPVVGPNDDDTDNDRGDDGTVGNPSLSTENGDGESDFGRYGMLAFGLMLGVALLLLYALLLVTLVPRYCKQRNSHDLTAAAKADKAESGNMYAMGQRSHTPLGPMTSATGLNGEYITSVDLDAAASGGGGGGAGKADQDVNDKPSGGAANDANKDAASKAADGDPEPESPNRFVSTFLIGRLSSSKPTDEETLPPDVTMSNDDNVFASGENSAASASQDPTKKEDDGHPLDSSDPNTSSSSSVSDDTAADREASKRDEHSLAPLAEAEDENKTSEVKLTIDPAGIFVSKPTDV